MFLVNYRKTFVNELIPRAKTEKRLHYYLPRDIFIDVFNKENNFEHKCWLMLAFCCGLRACEIATIRLENINYEENRINAIGKKIRKEYFVY